MIAPNDTPAKDGPAAAYAPAGDPSYRVQTLGDDGTWREWSERFATRTGAAAMAGQLVRAGYSVKVELPSSNPAPVAEVGQPEPPPPWERPGWRCEVWQDTGYDNAAISYSVGLKEPGDEDMDAADVLAVVYASPYRTAADAKVVAEHIAGDPSYLDRGGSEWRGIIDRREALAEKFAKVWTGNALAAADTATGADTPATEAAAAADDEQASGGDPGDLTSELQALAEATGRPLLPCLVRPGMVAFVTDGKVQIVAVWQGGCAYQRADGTFGAADWAGVSIDNVRPDPRFVGRELPDR